MCACEDPCQLWLQPYTYSTQLATCTLLTPPHSPAPHIHTHTAAWPSADRESWAHRCGRQGQWLTDSHHAISDKGVAGWWSRWLPCPPTQTMRTPSAPRKYKSCCNFYETFTWRKVLCKLIGTQERNKRIGFRCKACQVDVDDFLNHLLESALKPSPKLSHSNQM